MSPKEADRPGRQEALLHHDTLLTASSHLTPQSEVSGFHTGLCEQELRRVTGDEEFTMMRKLIAVAAVSGRWPSVPPESSDCPAQLEPPCRRHRRRPSRRPRTPHGVPRPKQWRHGSRPGRPRRQHGFPRPKPARPRRLQPGTRRWPQESPTGFHACRSWKARATRAGQDRRQMRERNEHVLDCSPGPGARAVSWRRGLSTRRPV